MVKKPTVRPVAWVALGSPGIYHLVDAFVWKQEAQEPLKPMCDTRKHALVYRRDGVYCRFCVVHEGLL